MKLGSIDHYQVLELEADAKPEAIRRAYYRLAKLHHPDVKGGQASDADNERFLAVQKAYEVLGDALSRQQYDEERERALRGGGVSEDFASVDTGTPTRPDLDEEEFLIRPIPGKKIPTLEEIRQAKQAFLRAEELIQDGEIEKAMTLMQAVVRTVEDEPEYLSLFGYALALNGQRLHVARDACRQAVEAQPYNMEYKARLAYVYLRAGLKNTAGEIFEEVLRQDPRNEIANVYGANSGGNGSILGGLKRIFRRD